MSRDLQSLISSAMGQGFPPALQIRVDHKGKKVLQKSFGQRFKYWDLGSLTKILVTTPLAIKLVEEKRLNLDENVSQVLPFFKNTKVGSIKIKSLLRHDSGLTWWRPYYKDLMRAPWPKRNGLLKKKFQKEKVGKNSKCVYSDLDFILMGWIIEEKLGMPLDLAAATFIWKPLKLKNTFFIKNNLSLKIPSRSFAPTERHVFRGLLRAVVFDDNCWSMGGVSGHAGLFSTLEDVGRMGHEFWRVSKGFKKGLWNPTVFKMFRNRAVPKRKGDWGLGFSIPSKPISTGGRRISTDAFGHTGYPGTSLWIDRKRDTVVTILANRTFPTRKDERFLELRRNIHDCVWSAVDRGGKS